MQKFIFWLDFEFILYFWTMVVFFLNQGVWWILSKRQFSFTQIPNSLKIILSGLSSVFVVIPILLLIAMDKANQHYVVFDIVGAYFSAIEAVFRPLENLASSNIYYLIFPLQFGIGFLPVLAVLGGAVLLLFKNITPQRRVAVFLATLVSGLLSSFLILIIFINTYFWTSTLQDTCFWRVQAMINFSPHVNDLCNQRPDYRECPKNEAELRAFNPPVYDEMKTCTESYYYFSEKKGQLWVVRQHRNEYRIFSRSNYLPSEEGTIYGAEFNRLKKLYAE